MKKFLSQICMAFSFLMCRNVAFNGEGWPNGIATLKPDEVFASRYLLGKRGAAASGVAVCDAGDLPLCVVSDEATADDVSVGLPKACHLLGAIKGTTPMVGAGVIPDDTDVYAVGGGKVDILADAAEGDYLVGRSFTACSGDGEVFHVVPVLPKDTVPGA